MRRQTSLPRGDTLLANDGAEASLRFVCPRCGSAFRSYVTITENGSTAEGCCICGLRVTVHASVDEPAAGGASEKPKGAKP